ncbi:hypothetical protein KIMH_01770 [Bombiscardovia apis]|uniref:Uncharacterized protein n=1 Tax=Bombiscardovia apis TaxID=2932182 RepID=A0ABN6SGP3_9BIFI|nr:hypothetical protein KIMH_01770 [Bombiscardovia apis]
MGAKQIKELKRERLCENRFTQLLAFVLLGGKRLRRELQYHLAFRSIGIELNNLQLLTITVNADRLY